MTPTFELGCQATSTTPFPASLADRRFVVGFWWLALTSRLNSKLFGASGRDAFVEIKDFVEPSKARNDGVPDVVRLEAHSGRGCSVSNLA